MEWTERASLPSSDPSQVIDSLPSLGQVIQLFCASSSLSVESGLVIPTSRECAGALLMFLQYFEYIKHYQEIKMIT